MTSPLSKRDLLLVIDQGGHASRALAFTGSGECVAQAVRPMAVQAHGERVEHDALALLASVTDVLDEIVRVLGDDVQRLDCAGVATQRASIVCWDKLTGAPLSPVLSWQDRRAAPWLSLFAAHASRIHEKTGLFLSPHYGVSKMRWCLEHLPAVAAAHREGRLCLGPLASFLLFGLLKTRPFLVDPANGARTLLMNLRTLQWDEELLALFGMPAPLLPQCVPTRFAFGDLTLGDRALPLVLLTGDQSAALFADGPPQSHLAYVNLGTGGFVQRILASPLSHPRLLTSVVYRGQDAAIYALEGTINGAGSALQWFASTYQVVDLERELPVWLERASVAPLFLNGVSGLAAPYWQPAFVSRFIGEGATWEKAVSVCESIAFLVQANLAEMAQALGQADGIVITGGLAELDGLCQRIADLTQLPVSRPRALEATARGTARLLSRASSWTPSPTETFSPNQNQPLHARHSRWCEAMREATAG